jgi:enediyne biosynthesis protein E4
VTERALRLILARCLILLCCVAPPARAQSAARPPAPVTFEEVAPKASGIEWTHNNAQTPERYLPETVGAGCVFFDFDNDGRLDLYLVNSGPSDFFTPKTPLKNALYRNRGDGRFEDVTERAGVAAPGWSTCAVWFDADADGRLDLFVSSFVQYTKETSCGNNRLGHRYYCIPRVFKPSPSRLFRNLGDGTFRDVSKESGITGSPGKSFGAVATDVNNDGLTDLFVANDTMANFLFVNQGGGKFEEAGLGAGVAYGETGSPRSGMGVDAADFDGDGWQDLFVANIDQELFSLYHNQKDLTFVDSPGEIAPATRLLSGWGLKFFDYDNDGDPDLLLANGHPDDMVEAVTARVKYREPLLMFENVGGAYRDVSARSGAAFKKDYSARGLAVGDYDNDGDLDVLVSNNGGAPLLLRNEGGNRQTWLGLRLVATRSNPAAQGAVITWQAGGVRRSRLKTTGGSYLASHDPREILGAGRAAKIDGVEIRWPSGRVDKLSNLPGNAYVKVVEGEGVAK